MLGLKPSSLWDLRLEALVGFRVRCSHFGPTKIGTGSQAVAHREEGDVEEEASPVPVERADLQEGGVERPEKPPLTIPSRRLPQKFGGGALRLAISECSGTQGVETVALKKTS